MEITVPKTKQQRDFEEKVKNLLTVLSEMSAADVQKVIEFAIFIANYNKKKRGTDNDQDTGNTKGNPARLY